MSKRKKKERRPVQVSLFTHTVLVAASNLTDIPIGRLIDRLVKDKYPELYKEES